MVRTERDEALQARNLYKTLGSIVTPLDEDMFRAGRDSACVGIRGCNRIGDTSNFADSYSAATTYLTRTLIAAGDPLDEGKAKPSVALASCAEDAVFGLAIDSIRPHSSGSYGRCAARSRIRLL